MGDITNKVLTVYKNDVSQAQQAVKSLRGVERERAKEVLDNLNRENAALESSLAKWAKVAGGIVAVGAAWKGAHAAAKAYLEDVRLESAAAGANVERLHAATRGLVEQDKLLEFAGKSLHGAWHLNQAEMERVLQGAMALRKTMGVELEPTVDALTDAISRGSTKALKEFGIEATSKVGVLHELDERVAQLGGNFDLAGDSMQRAGVTMADSLDDFAGAIGRVTAQLGPFMNKMADAIELAFDLGDSFAGYLAGVSSATNTGPASSQLGRQAEAMRVLATLPQGTLDTIKQFGFIGGASNLSAVQQVAGMGFSADDIRDLIGGDMAAQIKQLEAQAGKQLNREALEAGKQGIKEINWALFNAGLEQSILTAEQVAKELGLHPKKRGARGATLGYAPDILGAGQDIYGALRGGAGAVGGALQGAYDEARASQWQSLGGAEDQAGDKRFREEMAGARQDWLEQGKLDKLLAAQTEAEQHRKIFEAIFGTPEEISAITVGIGLAHQAFEGVSDSLAQSFEAWVTGSESAGAVFKRATAGLIHSMGVELAQVAAKHAVLAGVSAVTLDFAGAGMHAAAAAIAGSGSAAMLLVAQQMGYGASTPTGTGASGGAGAAVGGGYAGRGGGESNTTQYIYLAPDWDDETPSQRRKKLARAVRRGGASRTSNIVLHR